MTQATHTPGPWIAEFSDYGDEIWFGGYGAGMWTVDPPGAYLDGLSAANARLIAAAPELLAALEALMEGACEALSFLDRDTVKHLKPLIDTAETAITKATGASLT